MPRNGKHFSDTQTDGEIEAYYKILPNLNLKFLSIDTIFIPSDKRELRSKFLKKISEDDVNKKHAGQVIGGRDGLFLEKPDLINKYCRRIITEDHPELLELPLIQFGRMYQPIRGDKDKDDKKDSSLEKKESSEESKQDIPWKSLEDRIANYYVTVDPAYNKVKLPTIIRLKNCQPGEVSMWVKRSFPKAARFHKKKTRH